MARAKKNGKRKIENYTHKDKDRLNNPPAGLVTPETDRDTERKTYAYDPHLDPQLVWAGKAEHTSFEVPTVSLHVHERIDPASIIEAVKKRNGSDPQLSLFADPAENPPIREAIEFYKHKHNWSNRLIAGDSLLVMNSLLEKEGMAGQVQMVYIDPPYGIRYGSNFQPFVNKRDVKDGKDEDLNQEPEMIKAFRDTWELGIHSYLTYLRDRLLLARELLHESGSCFVQISDENLHLVRCLMDEVFGVGNFVGIIVFSKTTGFSGATLSSVADYLVWYGRDIKQIKYRQPLQLKHVGNEGATAYKPISEFLISSEYRHDLTRLATSADLTSQGASNTPQEFVFAGKIFNPPKGLHWKTTIDGMERLSKAGRIFLVGNTLRYLRFLDDFPVFPLSNVWTDTGIAGYTADKRYVVQTLPKVIERCLLMTTDPGDLVFDPTCGSGTTAYVAEKWGRRWITCDTSRVAVTLAKQRLMTTAFGYYELAHPEEGVSSGFRYGTVPHVTLKSIANNPEIREGMTQKQIDAAIAKYAEQETLYDQPFMDKSRTRMTGPFTVEAVPSPAVKPLDDLLPSPQPSPTGRGGTGRGLASPLPEGEGSQRPGEGKKQIPPDLLEFARNLRKEQTEAEHLLWALLRDRRFLGFKFRRQHPVDPYVLDFYCHEASLGIELDGGQHNEPENEAHDRKRTEFLAQKGIRVLRFWNNEVFSETEGILRSIYDALTPALSRRERGNGRGWPEAG